MNPTPYVMFRDGQCREAMNFYAGLFGGEVEMMMTMREAPMEPAPEMADWIMHASIRFDQGQLMGSDDVMGDYQPMAGNSIMMQADDAEKGRAIFEALTEGGEVLMAFQGTFFSAGFGMARDRFGIKWMIDSGDPTPEG